ncbi:SdiA-regulated domain-containing protein [bacterium]|nr:SdiA-regulated domain-containing protein [bacterium]
MRTVLSVMILSACLISTAHAEEEIRASLPDWKFEHAFSLEAVPEPSGLCFCPERNSLFIVDDGAQDRPPALFELDLEGNVLQKLEIGGDLEGVCYCPADGLVYVADEQEERIYAIDPEGLKLQQTSRVSRSLEGEELMQAGGNGFEGIEYIPAGHGDWSDCFILLNQDDPHGLLAIRRADLQSESAGDSVGCAWWDIAAINAGSLHFDGASGQLLVVHSWMNVMEIWDIETMQVLSWEVVPGAAQEAVAIDGGGRLWIGSDSGGLASYTAVE